MIIPLSIVIVAINCLELSGKKPISSCLQIPKKILVIVSTIINFICRKGYLYSLNQDTVAQVANQFSRQKNTCNIYLAI